MSFSSVEYFLFLTAAVIFYYILPGKWRNSFTLILSYYFYMRWNTKYALLLLSCTFSTYISALLMEKNVLNRRRLWLALCIGFNVSVLFFFKYFKLFTGITVNIILPVGISFFTFQAMGYAIDVYRQVIPAEKSIVDYGLFVAFFPQLASGPIGRAPKLLPQIKSPRHFNTANIFGGILLFLWGLFKKLVIADRLALMVAYVFDPLKDLNGMTYALGAFLFSIQIYCDFSAYSDMAWGSASVLGFNLEWNFSAPYFSATIKEFWRRWHISLSSWFRDYLYIPLGGSRGGRLRAYVNIMIVFMISGLWHGASWTFLFWGFIHGAYQVASAITKPLRDKLLRNMRADSEAVPIRVISCIITFTFVTLAFVFFRAESLSLGLHMIKSMAAIPFSGNFHTGITQMGVDKPYLVVVFAAIALVFAVDAIALKTNVIYTVQERPAIRYAAYFFLIASILAFGYYGSGYDPQNFIYFQF